MRLGAYIADGSEGVWDMIWVCIWFVSMEARRRGPDFGEEGEDGVKTGEERDKGVVKEVGKEGGGGPVFFEGEEGEEGEGGVVDVGMGFGGGGGGEEGEVDCFHPAVERERSLLLFRRCCRGEQRGNEIVRGRVFQDIPRASSFVVRQPCGMRSEHNITCCVTTKKPWF